MSLISDALKTAQRERTGRSQASKNSQPLIDGFFPYVSSSPARARSRRAPIMVVSAAGIVLLAVTGWLVWQKQAKVTPTGIRPPIVLPPPVTIAQTPSVTDTAVVAPDPRANVAPAEQPAAPATVNEPAARPQRSGSAPHQARVQPRDVEPPAGDAASRPAEPVARPQTPAVTRIDYEAQAVAAFNAGDLVGAREKFQLATRYAPTARAWTNYGVTLQQLGDFPGAGSAYQSAIGIDANYLEAWLFQGRLAALQGDAGKAIPLFQRARAINPRNADVNVELARLEYDAHNYTETKRFAEEAVRGDATNARGHWYLALASDALKDVDTAVRAYTAYLQSVGGAEREQAQFVGYARERLAALRGKP